MDLSELATGLREDPDGFFRAVDDEDISYPTDGHAFTHVHDLLVDDGLAYLTVPAHAWLWSVDDIRAGHHRRYNREGLAEVLDKAGFDVAYLTAFFRPLPVPVLLVRALPSRFGWRREDDLEAAARDQRAGPGVIGRVLDRLLAPEVDAIAAGRTVAMGTSLPAVARRR